MHSRDTYFKGPLLPDRIELGSVVLRPWATSDKPALLRHANNRNVWRNLRDRFPHPYNDADADAWISYAGGEPVPWGVYAIDLAGEAVGTISLRRGHDEERHSVEIGYWLAEPFWGRGIMTAVVGGITTLALEEPHVYRIFAPVFSWNPASMRVLQKAGFRREGIMRKSAVKDGVLIDQVLFAITSERGVPYSPAQTFAPPAD